MLLEARFGILHKFLIHVQEALLLHLGIVHPRLNQLHLLLSVLEVQVDGGVGLPGRHQMTIFKKFGLCLKHCNNLLVHIFVLFEGRWQLLVLKFHLHADLLDSGNHLVGTLGHQTAEALFDHPDAILGLVVLDCQTRRYHVGFLGFAKAGCDVVDGTDGPVKHQLLQVVRAIIS